MNNATIGRVELVFEFHTAREFSQVSLHVGRPAAAAAATSQALSQVMASFALDKGNYSGKTIRTNVTASTNSNIYNVTVDLKKRVGRFVRLQLDFAGPWLLLSEITFQSQFSASNVTDADDSSSSSSSSDHHFGGSVSESNNQQEERTDQTPINGSAEPNPSDDQGPDIPLPDDNDDADDAGDIEEISTGK